MRLELSRAMRIAFICHNLVCLNVTSLILIYSTRVGSRTKGSQDLEQKLLFSLGLDFIFVIDLVLISVSNREAIFLSPYENLTLIIFFFNLSIYRYIYLIIIHTIAIIIKCHVFPKYVLSEYARHQF